MYGHTYNYHMQRSSTLFVIDVQYLAHDMARDLARDGTL
jgi:hypothetical protein